MNFFDRYPAEQVATMRRMILEALEQEGPMGNDGGDDPDEKDIYAVLEADYKRCQEPYDGLLCMACIESLILGRHIKKTKGKCEDEELYSLIRKPVGSRNNKQRSLLP